MSEIIMTDSPDAAHPATLNGWMSRKGLFFHGADAESLARYHGCTHRPCEACGAPAPRVYRECDTCRAVTLREVYTARPKKLPVDEYLYSDKHSMYYVDLNDATENLADGESLTDMMLLTCEPMPWPTIDDDFFSDSTDDDHDLPDGISAAMAAFNAAMEKNPTNFWQPTKYAVDLSGYAGIITGEMT